MTRKQLRSLISAGVFSAALLSGVAYADETQNPTDTAQTKNQPVVAPVPAGTDPSSGVKQSTSTTQGGAQHGCAGAGGCGGK